ncbi:acyl carrier protein [Streptomyces xanthophaeus]|uniref:acyl carrier protein n=1 Tax=Streptomyces xanthophaeus TaxID=67385 RepID=UPI00343D03BF
MSTDVRGRLTAIWQEVFDTAGEEPDPDESFFEIGGTSHQAVQLMTRIEQTFGVKVPLPVIFAEGSIEGLSAAVDEARGAAGSDEDLLASVEALSDEEALRLLQEHEAHEAADRRP